MQMDPVRLAKGAGLVFSFESFSSDSHVIVMEEDMRKVAFEALG